MELTQRIPLTILDKAALPKLPPGMATPSQLMRPKFSLTSFLIRTPTLMATSSFRDPMMEYLLKISTLTMNPSTRAGTHLIGGLLLKSSELFDFKVLSLDHAASVKSR